MFAGVAVWQFEQLPARAVVYESQQYTMFVFGGLALAASGVFLMLAVWLGAWLSPKRHKAGLFSSAFIKGALVHSHRRGGVVGDAHGARLPAPGSLHLVAENH